MQKMADIIPKTIKNMNLQKKYNAQSVIVHWNKIVGADIATHTYPVIIQSGILVIGVNSSVWCHHLSMMKENIMEKINSFIGEKVILDIRFKVGSSKDCHNQETVEDEIQPTKKYKLSKVKLDDSEIQIIHDTVEYVQDKYLRQKILKVMRKDFVLKKMQKQNNWHQCASCTVLCPPDENHCSMCKLAKKHKIITNIIGTLKEIPWIRHNELNKHIPCTDEEFHQAKYTLVSSIGRALQDGDNDKFNIMIFIMLTTGAKIEAINEAIINKTLAKFRRKK